MVEQAPPATNRQSRGRLALRLALSLVLVVGIFYFLLKGINFAQVVAEIRSMTWMELATLSLISVWNLATYAFVWMSVTPGLSFWRAMLMTQSTTAVTNTVPAGSAIGIGMTYAMLGSWGYSRSRTTTAVLVSGVWNTFVKLAMPVLALALVALQGNAGGGRVTAALAGIAGLVGAIVVFALMLRSEELARRFGMLAGRVASRLLRLVGRPPVRGWELATVKFRARTLDLLERGWAPITVTTLVSHLSLYAVLLLALRHVGIGDAEVGWAEVLAVFAFARLATAIPFTPGGVGVVEAVLIGGLTTAGGDKAEVVAAVLLYRALTWGLPILVGIACYLWWRRQSLAGPTDGHPGTAVAEGGSTGRAGAGDGGARPRAVPVARRPSDMAWLGLGAAVLLLSALPVHADGVSPTERDAFSLVNGLPSLPFAIVWVPMQLGNFLVVPAAAVAAAVARRFRLAAGLALAGLGVYALAKVVKHFVLRGRPDTLLGGVVVRGAEPHGLGYVSGHIAVVTALVVVAWAWLPRWARWAAAGAAAAVFLTRMYVGAHLPLDMVGGAALGLAVGACVRLLLGMPAARTVGTT
jgi:putative heme transporter